MNIPKGEGRRGFLAQLLGLLVLPKVVGRTPATPPAALPMEPPALPLEVQLRTIPSFSTLTWTVGDGPLPEGWYDE